MHQLVITQRFAPKRPDEGKTNQYPRVRKCMPHGVANTGAGSTQHTLTHKI